jgi:hypothetical protein
VVVVEVVVMMVVVVTNKVVLRNEPKPAPPLLPSELLQTGAGFSGKSIIEDACSQNGRPTRYGGGVVVVVVAVVVVVVEVVDVDVVAVVVVALVVLVVFEVVVGPSVVVFTVKFKPSISM